jgi:hypothetical protein
MEDVVFRAILSILWPTGILYGHLVHFVGHLVYFFPFWYVVPKKFWQPWILQNFSEGKK